MILKEELKDAKGYENYIQISNYGVVHYKERIVTTKDNKLKHIKAKIKHPPSNGEYHSVYIYEPSKPIIVPTHILVAKTFIPNPENKPFVNHIDGVKSNCRVDNLEWVTQRENSIHAVSLGLIKVGQSHPNAKLTDEMVRDIRKLRTNGAKVSDLAKLYNVTLSCIESIVNYRSRKSA